MRRAVLLITAILALPAAAQAASNAVNFQTSTSNVVCGIAMRVPGSRFDPGSGVSLDGEFPGLQCSAQGIPKPRRGVGDPFVQLGQGRAGRARIVNESQDDLISSSPFVKLAPSSAWTRDGITCRLAASSVRCTNVSGHGFTLSSGHVHLF